MPTSRRASVSAPTFVGRLPCLPLLICQKVPRHQLWEYITRRPAVNCSGPAYRVPPTPLFKPTLGLADPSPPAGMYPPLGGGTLDLTDAVLWRFPDVGAGYCSVPAEEVKPVRRERRDARIGACRPEGSGPSRPRA